MLLKNCIDIKNGKDYSHLSKGDIPVIGTGGAFEYVDKFLYDKEALLLPRKGSLNSVGYINNKKFWTVDTMFYAIPTNKNVNLKYVYYYLTLIDLNRFDIGSTIPSMTTTIYYNIDIPMPDKLIQDKIVEILSNIDNQIERNNTMVKTLQVLGNTIYSKNIKETDSFFTLDEDKIKTGKQDANFATPNGKYKFFTCSEDSFLCDSYEFDGKNILIAGNGNFNVKFYDGQFNAYQRTYVIKDEEIYGNLYYTYSYNTQSLLKGANGSIIKFMTIGMLKDIQIPCFSDETNNTLNSIVSEISYIKQDIDNLNKLKQTLLPLLINGQLVV